MKRHPIEILMNKGAKKKWPVNIHFDLTYKCNERCIHCYVVKQKRKELSLHEVKQALFQLADAHGLLLTLSGGEIFTREDVLDILMTTKKLNFRTVILSNGSLITAYAAKWIKKTNVAEVQISIYNADAHIHDTITRSKNSFKQTMKGIGFLKKEGVRVVLKTPLMRHTFKDYKKIKLFADKLGIEYLFGPVILPKMNFDKSLTHLSPNVNQLKKLFLDSSTLKKDLEAIKIRAESYNLKSNLNKPICDGGFNRCYISPYGDVFPCGTLRIKVGNLRDNTFREIWDHSTALRDIRGISVKMMEECLQCGLLAFCIPCPGMGHQGTGNLLKPYKLHCKIALAKKKAIEKNTI